MHAWMGMIICCKLKYWDPGPLNYLCADCLMCSGKHFKISDGTIFKETGLNNVRRQYFWGKIVFISTKVF